MIASPTNKKGLVPHHEDQTQDTDTHNPSTFSIHQGPGLRNSDNAFDSTNLSRKAEQELQQGLADTKARMLDLQRHAHKQIVIYGDGASPLELLQDKFRLEQQGFRVQVVTDTNAVADSQYLDAPQLLLPEDHEDRVPAEPLDLLTQFRWNEVGIAELYAHLFKTKIRYSSDEAVWHVWKDGVWAVDTDNSCVHRLAEQMLNLMQCYIDNFDADDPAQAKMQRIYQTKFDQICKQSYLTNVIQRVGRRVDVQAPSIAFDAPEHLLNVRNGTINLRTGKLQTPDRADLLEHKVDVAFDPNATCPRWEQFLHEVFEGDVERIAFMQRAVGYTLTAATTEQCMFILHGFGCNGKSTFTDILSQLVGSLATSVRINVLELMQTGGGDGPTDSLANMKGRRLVLSSETSSGKRLDEALIKDITGCDTISARRLHSKGFTFKPKMKVWMACNHKPTIAGNDKGIWRRVRLVPFNVSFEDRKDYALTAKLTAELPGIMAWAVRGAVQWHATGLGSCEAVDRETAEYRAENDIIGQFLEDSATVGDGLTEDNSRLYGVYASWCVSNGNKQFSHRAFTQRMRERGFNQSRTNKGRYWEGLRLNISNSSYIPTH